MFARESGDPIQLQWMEGDVAGMTAIWSPDGTKVIGFVEYHQHREGDHLEAARLPAGTFLPVLPSSRFQRH